MLAFADTGIPALESAYPLSDADRAQFAKDGHIALPGVLSPNETDAVRAAVRRTVEANMRQHHALENDVAAAANNWQFVNNLWLQDDAVRRLIQSPRIARIAADLLGVDRLRLYRDQSYFKGVGGAGTPWHQDGIFIPLAPQRIVTAWIALTDIGPNSSPMTYASAPDDTPFRGLSAPGEPAMRQFHTMLAGKGYGFTTYDALAAGDVTFHAADTLHATFAHRGTSAREAVVIVYFADGARVVIDPPGALPPHIAQVRSHSRAISMPGLGDGDLADSEMTPIVYDRAADIAA